MARTQSKTTTATKAPAGKAGAHPENSPPPKYVYFFGAGSAEGDRTLRDLLGGKGANLAEMTNAGLPVPPGFTVSTEACTAYYEQRRRVPAAIDREMEAHLARLEALAGAKVGRCGSAAARVGSLGRQVLDAGDDGHHPEPRPERPCGRGAQGAHRERPVRLRQLPALRPDVRQRRAGDSEGGVRGRVRRGQGAPRGDPRHGARRGRPARGGRAVQGGGDPRERRAVSARPAAAAPDGARRGLPLVAEPAREGVPPHL